MTVKLRNDCRLAEQILTSGHPDPHLEWARGMIGYCGEGVWARTVSVRVLRLRSSTDKQALVAEWNESQWLSDGTFYAAAMEIAADRDASSPARVYAFLALARWKSPRVAFSYPAFVGGFDERMAVRGGCEVGDESGNGTHHGPAPLPADYSAQIDALSRRIALDPSEPTDVRTAASCTYSHFQRGGGARPSWLAAAMKRNQG